MNFNEIPYKRITIEEITDVYQALILDLEKATNADECLEVIKRRYNLNEMMTPMDISYLRHDMNLNDNFYSDEQDYYNSISSKISELSNKFDKLLLDSPYRDELEKILGHQSFVMMEVGAMGYDSRLAPITSKEYELTNRYNRLCANATVTWEGKEISRSAMGQYSRSSDRDTRKTASLAISDSCEKQREEIEEIYSSLIELRNERAKILGIKNFSLLSFNTMCRIGYDQKDVAVFRDEVKKYIVPVWQEFEKRRAKRLGLSKLYSYDSGIFFKEGNPKPLGDSKFCLEMARQMYHGISKEAGEFIDALIDNHMYDVEDREGKNKCAYMYYLHKYKSPFILASFNGTQYDPYIMCHEGGHAFQSYMKRNEEIRDRCGYTYEAAETHAMTMEFFAHPYMELFFGDRAKDYRTFHLEDAIRLILSECLQDEFQQLVYENPEMTNEERNKLWLRLDSEYFPGKSYGDDKNLLEGCGWQRIPHVIIWPFYAIDYALAEICALEYYEWMNRNHDEAWESYLSFCMDTGIKDYHTLIKNAGLPDPFEPGTLPKLANWLLTL
jgi:M3 family oligoendopeptidase